MKREQIQKKGEKKKAVMTIKEKRAEKRLKLESKKVKI